MEGKAWSTGVDGLSASCRDDGSPLSREVQVLQHIASGSSTKEVARTSGSPRTVQDTPRTDLRQLGANVGRKRSRWPAGMGLVSKPAVRGRGTGRVESRTGCVHSPGEDWVRAGPRAPIVLAATLTACSHAVVVRTLPRSRCRFGPSSFRRRRCSSRYRLAASGASCRRMGCQLVPMPIGPRRGSASPRITRVGPRRPPSLASGVLDRRRQGGRPVGYFYLAARALSFGSMAAANVRIVAPGSWRTILPTCRAVGSPAFRGVGPRLLPRAGRRRPGGDTSSPRPGSGRSGAWASNSGLYVVMARWADHAGAYCRRCWRGRFRRPRSVGPRGGGQE